MTDTDNIDMIIKQALPCPFCGSTALTDSTWCDDDGEYLAIACRGCKAEAPASSWNQRVNRTQKTFVQMYGTDTDIPDNLKNI